MRPDGSIVGNWKEGDGAVRGERRMSVPKAGELMDRIGGKDGVYFSPMDENGNPYDLPSRGTGDRLPEANIADNDSYHKYKVNRDFTRENLEDAINNADISKADKEHMLEKLKHYYDDCMDPESNDHKGDVYAKNKDEADGVKTGPVDSMFTDNDGGAQQYIMPLTAEELENIGMIEELKR